MPCCMGTRQCHIPQGHGDNLVLGEDGLGWRLTLLHPVARSRVGWDVAVMATAALEMKGKGML